MPSDGAVRHVEPGITEARVPKVRVIVVNYNAGSHLAKTLKALQEQTESDFEAVVIDNASTDGSLAGAVPDDSRFTTKRLDRNVGFADANNVAARDARTPLLALLNPDAIPREDWLERLIAASDRYPWASMFASVQLQTAQPTLLDGLGDAYSAFGIAWRGGYGKPVPPDLHDFETFAPCAAAAAYRTELFAALGGFDGSFFCYYEDVDLALRMRLRGARAVLVMDAVVLHTGSMIAGDKSRFTTYHLARNQLWTFVKNAPWPLLLPLAPVHVAAILAQTVAAMRQRRARPYCRGVIDALIGLGPVLGRRREVQGTRTISSWHLARALIWSPRKARSRAVPKIAEALSAGSR